MPPTPALRRLLSERREIQQKLRKTQAALTLTTKRYLTDTKGLRGLAVGGKEGKALGKQYIPTGGPKYGEKVHGFGDPYFRGKGSVGSFLTNVYDRIRSTRAVGFVFGKVVTDFQDYSHNLDSGLTKVRDSRESIEKIAKENEEKWKPDIEKLHQRLENHAIEWHRLNQQVREEEERIRAADPDYQEDNHEQHVPRLDSRTAVKNLGHNPEEVDHTHFTDPGKYKQIISDREEDDFILHPFLLPGDERGRFRDPRWLEIERELLAAIEHENEAEKRDVLRRARAWYYH